MTISNKIKARFNIKSSYQSSWWITHTFFTFIYCLVAILILGRKIFLLESPFRFVTNIQLALISIVFVCMYKENWRNFCFKYFFLPTINLVWLIVLIRGGFDIIGGISWNIGMETDHPTGAPQYLRETFDLIYHYIPIFVMLHIHSFFSKEFFESQRGQSLLLKVFNIFGPYFAIILWSTFYNPFDTYLMPQNGITSFVFYNFNFFVLIPMSLLLSPPLAEELGMHFTRKRVPSIGIIASFIVVVLLIDLYGISVFIRLPVATSCLLMMLVFAGCLMKEKWTPYIILPVFAFSFTSLAVVKILLTQVDDFEFLVSGLRDQSLFSFYSVAMMIFSGILLPLLMVTINYYLLDVSLPNNTMVRVFREQKKSRSFYVFTRFGAFFLISVIMLLDYVTDITPLMYMSTFSSNALTLAIALPLSYFLVRRLSPSV